MLIRVVNTRRSSVGVGWHGACSTSGRRWEGPVVEPRGRFSERSLTFQAGAEGHVAPRKVRVSGSETGRRHGPPSGGTGHLDAHSQAQGSKGPETPATAERVTAPDDGARPWRSGSEERRGGQPPRPPRRERPGGKGSAVNARARKSTGGDAGPRCRRGARLRRAERHRGETRFAAGGNTVNPRIGSGMQQARRVEGGENRRGGAKPRGRNTETAWPPAPEGRAETRDRALTPPAFETMEGRSLDKPKRGSPAGRSGGTDRVVVGKDGVKVRRDARAHPNRLSVRPVR